MTAVTQRRVGVAAGAGAGADEELPELTLVRALPGFPGLDRFALVRLDHVTDAAAAADAADAAAAADAADDADAADEPVAAHGPDGASIAAEDDAPPLMFELRSLQVPDVRFLVAAPAVFFPDYTFTLDDDAAGDLGLRREEDAVVLVIMTIDRDSASITANLLAPVVVNVRNRSAAQVILSGTDWPVRATVA